jgi:hypothetical protein
VRDFLSGALSSDWRFNIEMIDSWRLARGKLGG